MALSGYWSDLRRTVGHRLLLMPTVACVIRSEDRNSILLQRRSDTKTWTLPGGVIDPGETPAEATVREVREETGLHVTPVRIVGVFGGPVFRRRYPTGDLAEPTIILFEGAVIGGRLEPEDEESEEVTWWALNALPDLKYPTALLASNVDGQVWFDHPSGT